MVVHGQASLSRPSQLAFSPGKQEICRQCVGKGKGDESGVIGAVLHYTMIMFIACGDSATAGSTGSGPCTKVAPPSALLS
jgi:hypothetical protein